MVPILSYVQNRISHDEVTKFGRLKRLHFSKVIGKLYDVLVTLESLRTQGRVMPLRKALLFAVFEPCDQRHGRPFLVYLVLLKICHSDSYRGKLAVYSG